MENTIKMENSQKPAFANMPSHTDPKHTIGEYGGLTKREYFAAMAMQALIQSDKYSDRINPEYLAKTSILYSDELLKQLGDA